MKLRWSVGALLICIAWIAIGIVATRSATIWWASITFSLTLLLLGLAAVAAIFADEKTRAFRIGFTVWGCGYFALVFAPLLDRQVGQRLITTKLFALAHPWMHETRPTSAWYGSSSASAALSKRNFDLLLRSSSGPVPIAAPQWDPFQQTCHSLITIPIACMGGMFGLFFRKRRC